LELNIINKPEIYVNIKYDPIKGGDILVKCHVDIPHMNINDCLLNS